MKHYESNIIRQINFKNFYNIILKKLHDKITSKKF